RRGREECSTPRSPKVFDGLIPNLSAIGMVSQTVGVLSQSIRIQRFDGLDDPGVEDSAWLGLDGVVCYLVREPVLERVVDIRTRTRLLEELRGREPTERGA